jgi:hypothetical protein
MAQSTQKTPDYVYEEIARQDAEREAYARKEIERQDRLRAGDYPMTTVPGIGQTAVGVVENFLQMATGFAAAVPGAVRGATWAVLAPEGEKAEAYSAGFAEGTDRERWYTYEPKSIKGKKYEAVIADTYNEYIQEKWGNEYLGGLVEQGIISPEEATYYRTSADALLMGLFIKAGSYAKGFGKKKPAGKYNRVNVDAMEGDVLPAGRGGKSGLPSSRGATVEGEVIRPLIGEQKKLPAPQRKLTGQEQEVSLAVRQALEAKGEQHFGPKDSASNQSKAIFKNRQAGAIDPEVFTEVARVVARPGVMTAKMAADLGHALVRQIAFKHVTDIRKLNSPTAKILADRIMPLENSTITLGGGFHERISLAEGHYNSRIENILAPLRKHVVNKNAAKTLRVIALPKRINDELFRGMDTGIVREDLVPAVKALRSIFNEIYEYQKEAGVDIGYLENQIPHVWNPNKIARAEWGKKNGGEFTRYLMEEEGLSFDVAQEVIATITKEEGFLDFVEDTGGRLRDGMDYQEWSRAHRVGGGPSRPGHVQHRVLSGKSKAAKKWLVTDVESLLTNYVNRAVQHAEYTRIAGRGEKNLNQLVRQIVEEVAFHGKEGGKLRASSPHTTAQEIYDVFDALQNKFHFIKTPSVRRASKAIAGYEVIQKLGLVALAQFPETMMPAARYRVATSTKAMPGVPIPLKSYAVGIVDSLHNGLSNLSVAVTGKRAIPKSEMREHLERIGVIYTSSLASSATRMSGPVGVITNRVIRAFGMEAITNLQRSIALDTIQSMIRENSRALAKGLAQGKKEKMYRQELIELGINPEVAIDWYRAGMPKDHPISTKFDVAHVRAIDTTIIMPKAANAPRLYNDPRFQLPLIFTRFFTAFGNTVMKSLGQKLASRDVTNIRKLGSIGSLVAAVGIAYYTQFLREAITGYQYRDEDDPMRVVDAYDRSGLTAMFTRLYPLFSAYKYGAGSKIVAGVLGGPFASDVAGFIEAAQGTNEQRARFLARQTPIMTISPESEDIMYEFYLELIEGLPD